jgi:hypothetical protein
VLPKEVYRLKQLEADSKTFKRSSDMFNFMITDQQKMIASYYMALAELEVYMQGFENGWSDEINKEINKIVNGAPFWRHPAIRERDWERLDPSEQHVAREDVHNLGYVFKKSAELSTLARELRRKAERDALLADPWWDEVKDEMRKSVSMFKEDSIMTLTHHEIKAASLKAALEKGQKAQVALDIAIPKQKRLVEELASNEDENGACKVQVSPLPQPIRGTANNHRC